jgi:hypothetical protein
MRKAQAWIGKIHTRQLNSMLLRAIVNIVKKAYNIDMGMKGLDIGNFDN